jgi:hypothetical protein
MSKHTNQNAPADSIESQDDSSQSTRDGSPTTRRAVSTTSERPSDPELPLDTIFELLRNDRRRRVLEYLDENDGEATLSDLAERIAAIENDTTEQALSSQQRKRVYVGLYQCHLPKMDGAGVIDFDENRGDVVRKPAADQLRPYLEAATTEEDTPLGMPAVSLLGSVACGSGYLGARLLHAIPPVFDVLAGVMILLVTVPVALELAGE